MHGTGGSVFKCMDCGKLFLKSDPDAHEFKCIKPEKECIYKFGELCTSHSYWPEEDKYDKLGWECVHDIKNEVNVVDVDDF